MSIVTELLANRSSEEKRTLLLELLRELAQQSPTKPIPIQDDSGKLLGLFSPMGINAEDDFFVEGSPGFFRELERRRQANNLISVEDALAYLRGDAGAK
jgi:hypothetical protein